MLDHRQDTLNGELAVYHKFDDTHGIVVVIHAKQGIADQLAGTDAKMSLECAQILIDGLQAVVTDAGRVQAERQQLAQERADSEQVEA